MMLQPHVARDGEEFAVRSNGGDWLTSWHPPIEAPAGTPHGANAFCVTADDGVVPDQQRCEAMGMAWRSSRG